MNAACSKLVLLFFMLCSYTMFPMISHAQFIRDEQLIDRIQIHAKSDEMFVIDYENIRFFISIGDALYQNNNVRTLLNARKIACLQAHGKLSKFVHGTHVYSKEVHHEILTIAKDAQKNEVERILDQSAVHRIQVQSKGVNRDVIELAQWQDEQAVWCAVGLDITGIDF